MVRDAVELYRKRSGFGRFSPKVVLFDMDGTLVDSMPNHAAAWTEMFRGIGIDFTREDAYITEGARGVDTIRKYVLEQKGLSLAEETARKAYDEKARIFALQPAPAVMPGALEIMEKASASGMVLGIVTGSAQRPLIARILGDFGRYITESHIVTAFDVTKGKPDPEPYLRGMEKCGGFRPWETIVVENAPLGVKSGHASGAFTVALNTGPLDDGLLLGQGADLLYGTMREFVRDWDRLLGEADG